MRTTIALVAALALLVPTGAGAATRTIALVAKPTSVTSLVRGGKSPKPGSSFVEYGVLLQNGARAGSYAAHGLLATPLSVGVEIATDTFVLAGGTIVAIGSHRSVDRFTLPVVGGTGSYTGASGTVSVAPGAKGTELLTFRLVG